MKLVNLPPGSREFEEVAQHITKSYANACVMFIEKIEDHPHEGAYRALKDCMKEPNERTLFHGTTEKGAYSIATHGYDPLMNRRAAFGKGTYFASTATLSSGYMDIAHTSTGFDLSYMLVNKVLVGRMALGSNNSVIEKSKADTQVNSVQSPTIFAVPLEEQAIPQYLVAFHKNAPK